MTMRLPKGIELNGKKLRIEFTYKGKRYREPLPSIVTINKASIAYADNKRRTILVEIKEGKFDFVSHFPDSPRTALFLGLSGTDAKRTVSEGIERWMEVQRATKATSTVINYTCKARHVESRLGKRRIVDTSKSELELFRATLLREGLTAHLKKATVQHRGVNQCRHTFASQALSSFVPVEWVARQLGHTDTTMVKKHYGRWIPSDTKSMADLVSKMMGVDRVEAD